MILRCISPKGDSCTIRVSTQKFMNLVLNLEGLGFTQFEIIPEYRKFHTSKYLGLVIGLNHWVSAVNRLNGSIRLDKLGVQARKQMIERMIDESLTYAVTH